MDWYGLRSYATVAKTTASGRCTSWWISAADPLNRPEQFFKQSLNFSCGSLQPKKWKTVNIFVLIKRNKNWICSFKWDINFPKSGSFTNYGVWFQFSCLVITIQNNTVQYRVEKVVTHTMSVSWQNRRCKQVRWAVFQNIFRAEVAKPPSPLRNWPVCLWHQRNVRSYSWYWHHTVTA